MPSRTRIRLRSSAQSVKIFSTEPVAAQCSLAPFPLIHRDFPFESAFYGFGLGMNMKIMPAKYNAAFHTKTEIGQGWLVAMEGCRKELTP